ncbi:MAG: transmembrane sensor [Arenicella sp.]|jgi:transmembrane sensor
MTEFDDILAKHFAGEASQEEEQQVQAWKVENEEEYKLVSSAWSVSLSPSDKNYDAKAAWNKIDGSIVEEAPTKVIKMSTFMKSAIAACIVALIGITAFNFFGGSDLITVTNETAETMQVDLPDGTEIYLASNAEIIYSEDFKENRDIELSGEAFFEVMRDEKHPFIITTEKGEIEVLGTAFTIQAYKDSTTVLVEHGLVALRNKVDEIKLKKGESATSTSTEISKVSQVEENYFSWKTGVFDFTGALLKDVASELNQYYETQIAFDLGNETIMDVEFTGRFENLSHSDVIEIIVLTCSVTSEEINGKVVLR